MVKSSCSLSADSVDDMEMFEDKLSTYVQDAHQEAQDNESLSKFELAERLQMNMDELNTLLEKPIWTFKQSIQVALAMGLNVSIGVSNME